MLADMKTSVLLTDLYQLTMLQGYFDQRMEGTAVFEFFVRKLPAKRNFLIAAGLEQALAFLETVQFFPEELDWIASYGAFRPAFVQYLESFRFRGDVYAMPEGTVFFPNEPILRVTAPIDRVQSGALGLNGTGQAFGRFRFASCSWRRGRSARCAGKLSSRIFRQRDGIGGATFWRARLRHHGPLFRSSA